MLFYANNKLKMGVNQVYYCFFQDEGKIRPWIRDNN